MVQSIFSMAKLNEQKKKRIIVNPYFVFDEESYLRVYFDYAIPNLHQWNCLNKWFLIALTEIELQNFSANLHEQNNELYYISRFC